MPLDTAVYEQGGPLERQITATGAGTGYGKENGGRHDEHVIPSSGNGGVSGLAREFHARHFKKDDESMVEVGAPQFPRLEICALQSELTAAMSMLNERHDQLPQRPNDTNTYILGRIAGHDVVIACLPEMRITPAARVAKQMSTIYTGTSGKQYGAVVQWDYGKTEANGEFVHYGSLNAPPALLSTVVNTLRAEHNLKNSEVELYLRQGYSLLSTSATLEYQRPSAENDILFESDYDSSSSQSTRRDCDACDRGRLTSRAPREDQTVIHYGTIASGNQVIKHGIARDEIGKKFSALCFEMEAAGIVDNFPCVVIRDSVEETIETKLSGFMRDYHSELLSKLDDFPNPKQQRDILGAMLRLTKGQFNQDFSTRRTLLHWLSMNGGSNLLLELVELRFRVNDKDSDDRTPLHLDVMGNHYSAVKMLITNCGADCHGRDLNGLLPWHHALHIDWGNIFENDQRAAWKKSIIRLLTKETGPRSPSLALNY
ncbi:hypothetical protein G7Y89_g15620 [Cudoniella acicularis]|uniref:Uncharacterized protein n=1 Tax=Cudoniella acicularis TaxID=354080 RepID=A0A8H4QI73_9HELO|nr:hypothetical protein G7Y89_g15620 [Cudoniella acicularis]